MSKEAMPFIEPFETDCDPCYAPDCPHTLQCIKLLQAENERLKEQIEAYENRPAAITCPKCSAIIKAV